MKETVNTPKMESATVKSTATRKIISSTLRWDGAIIDEKSPQKGVKSLTLGTDAKSDFVIPEEFCKFGSFDFLTRMGDEWNVNIPEGFDFGCSDLNRDATPEALLSEGRIHKGTISGARYTLDLKSDAVCFIKNGPIRIEARYGDPKMVLRSGAWKAMDKAFMGWFLLSTVLILSITILTILFFKDSMLTSPDDLNKQINKFVKVVMKEPEKKEEVKDLNIKKIETKKLDLQKYKTQNKGPTIADVNKREQDRKIALKSGILGAIGAGGSAATNSIFGAGLGSGINNALTGLHGTMIGSTDGLGGLGSRGGGGGGGAMAIGALGTYGAGRSGRSYGDVSLSGKGKSMESVKIDKLILVGGLEKDVIAKVIQRHWAQIKYCYEKELSKNPNLFGKVVTQFTIGSTGKVDEAHIAQTEMNNDAVESCMVRNIRTWVFPQPKGGGVVLVTYPFIFKSAGL